MRPVPCRAVPSPARSPHRPLLPSPPLPSPPTPFPPFAAPLPPYALHRAQHRRRRRDRNATERPPSRARPVSPPYLPISSSNPSRYRDRAGTQTNLQFRSAPLCIRLCPPILSSLGHGTHRDHRPTCPPCSLARSLPGCLPSLVRFPLSCVRACARAASLTCREWRTWPVQSTPPRPVQSSPVQPHSTPPHST